MKRLLSLILCVLLMAVLIVPAASAADGVFIFDEANSTIGVPTLEQYAQWGGGTLAIKKVGGSEYVRVKSIEMVTSTNISEFPFAVDQLNYVQNYQINNGIMSNTKNLYYSVPAMRVRGDAAQNYYDIPIIVRFCEAKHEDNGVFSEVADTDDSQTLTFRVLITNKDNGGGGGDSTHIPKVIVSNFTTSPSQVIAGEDFTIAITFKNTSDSGTISNMKAALSSTDSVFTPVSGSSTLFIESLAPGATKTLTMLLHTKDDATPGSYGVTFNLNYDAPNTIDNAPATDTETVAIPVKQVPKAQFSKIQLSPTDIYTNQDLNVMASVNNTGKSKIYNVNAVVSDSKGLFVSNEQYLGNIEPGASGAIDLYVSTQTAGDTSLKLDVTYEDETGEKYTYSEAVDVMVTDKQNDFIEEPIMPEEPVQSAGGLWWLWIVLALVIAGIVVLVILKRNKKKQAALRDRLDAKRLEEQYLKEQSAYSGSYDEDTKV